jgi:pimeloyl-[acyl-carrier protein] synthase
MNDILEAPIENDILDIPFDTQAYLSAPWRFLRRIAQVEPLFWSDKLEGWVVTRHPDVKAAFADSRLSAARMEMYLRALPGDPAARFSELVKYHLLGVDFMDDPAHRRVRLLMMKAFGRRQVEGLKPMIAEIIVDVLNKAEEAREFDFIDLVSSKLPTRVIQGMLGVPASMTGEFFRSASAVIRAVGSVRPSEDAMAQADAAIRRLNAIFSGLIDERRSAPTEDVLSLLVRARDADDRLSEDELLAACHSIIEAGAETTAHMLAVATNYVATRPGLRILVEKGVEDALRVVDELLRFPGLVMGITRSVKEPFEWHGKRLEAGQIIFMMNGAANVDPAVFKDPETIDPGRNNQASLSFGPGLHHCIGYFLARAELAEFLHAAFTRFDIQVLQTAILFIDSYVFRGYKELQVRFTPKAERAA